MAEPFFAEMVRYVEFGAADEAALRRLAPLVAPHAAAIADAFYARIGEHAGARKVVTDEQQVTRLKLTLQAWLRLLLEGPWDQAYFERRARIGKRHVEIALPQRYMFGGMAFIRHALADLAEESFAGADRRAVVCAVNKILDLELAIMLETYAEASLERAHRLEQVEKELLEHEHAARTRRAERLASLGTMAAGLAHEIRNPLNAAHLQLTLVERRLARVAFDVPGALTAAGLAAAEIQRLAALVGEFLDFARPQPLRRSVADLRQTAESVVALIQPEAERTGIALALAPGHAVELTCDDEKIRQVLHNLLRNAIEATGQGGVVTIRVHAEPDRAVLEVEDDGPGFPSDAPVFEPFFTTKEAGTGLGLSIVHRIVTDHGGTIDVRTRPGATVFALTLPRDLARNAL